MKELSSSYRDALIIKNHPQVYTPQEDTLLLANNLKVEWNSKVLEIGVGSGYISLLAAEKAEKVIGIDINPHAIRLAKLNAELNGIENVEFILGDLFSPISNNFHLILFNPPYLQEIVGIDKNYIDYSWSGGRDGREITKKFLDEADEYLLGSGRILIIQSSLSGYDSTISILSHKGFKVEIIAEKKLFFERLYLIEAVR